MKLQPQIVEIPYGVGESDRHRLVLAACQQRRKMSFDKMSQRYQVFADMEEKFRAYIKPTKGNDERKQLKKDGKPQFVTVELPYSFALLMTFHTYMTSVFLSRNPVFQYEGRHGESQEKSQAVEALIDYQLNVGQMLVPLYVWLMDMGKYGLGVIGSHWAEESATTTETFEELISYLGIKTGAMRKGKRTIKIPGYKGNKLFNVRPQDWFPDPRVSLARFQEGEFCGRRVETGWNTILKREAEGRYYNISELKKRLKTRFDYQRDRGSPQLALPDAMETYYIPQGSIAADAELKNFVELFELEVELIPKDWGFGTSPFPEKWAVTIGNNEVILSVEPLGLYHDKFTFDILEYEIEGYALSKRSMLEVLEPLNDTMSWLFNTHMHNVRRALNDQLIVDPSGIVMKDMQDPGAGRLVRLKPEAYGKPTNQFVTQLQITDITQNHMRDAMLVGEMMQRVSGVVESVMGMLSSSGRKTATEVRTSSSFSVNRLKTNAEYASSMGFAPLAMKLLQTTQQKYDGDLMFRVAGELYQTKTPMKVTAEDIAGFYDFVPVDGTMPVDRYAQAMLWKELLGAAGKMPQLAGQLDFMAMMKHIAFLSGVKNFSQFEVKVLPDAQVAANAAAGNVVPLGGPSGPGTSAGPGTGQPRGPSDVAQVSQLGSIPGVGRAA